MEYVAGLEAEAREFDRQGIDVEPVPIDVPHMPAWCAKLGLEIDTIGEA